MEQTKKVPVLRFPEFLGEWEEKRLGKITVKVGSGSTPRGGEKVYQSSGIPFIRSQNVNNDYLSLNDLVFIPENINNQMQGSIVKPNDILLNITGASIGRSCIVPIDFNIGNVNQHVCIVRLKNEYNSKFFQLYLSSSRGQKSVLSFQVGSGREGLNFQAIRSFSIYSPALPEQQKIADFLTQIDNKINQLSQKKQLLERYKKGVMQQIFSQSIRFTDDDGREFPEWEVKNFGEIFSFRTTNSFSRENLNYEDGFVKNIHYGDIHTKFSMQFDITKEQVPFINSEIELKRVPEDNYCKSGDLIITDASEDYADIGKCIEVVNLNNEKVLAGLHTILARPDLYKMYVGFSGYLMKCDNVSLQIKVIAQGSKVLSISSKRLSELKLAIPSLPEQAKIANFLTALDNKIALVESQLNGTKQYKKGLLQQMFI